VASHQQTHGALAARRAPAGLAAGSTLGNERLTALSGATLIALLALLGVTIIDLRPLLWLHLFVGLLLIGPVALKLGSTGYRFMRYYAGSPGYRLRGTPPALLRFFVAPAVVASTVVVFATGVALLLAGPGSRGSLLPLHKISFIVWLAFTSLHVLAHLPATARALSADLGTARAFGTPADGRPARILSVAATLVAGSVLAVVLIPRYAPWLHDQLKHR
jgi:hypothetical protein